MLFLGNWSSKLLIVYLAHLNHILNKEQINAPSSRKGVSLVMELINIILTGSYKGQASTLEQRMVNELKDLHNDRNGVTLKTVNQLNSTEIKCTGVLPGFELTFGLDQVIKSVSKAIANFVIEEKEQRFLRYIITKDYGYNQQDEIDHILEYCNQFLNGIEESESGQAAKKLRLQKVMTKVQNYLEEHTHINIEGFMRFRLRSYLEELNDIVEYAIDEFLMEKQYQEFISLLKYFVYIQEAKIPVAHLMHRGGHEFTLLNESMQPIDTDQYENFTVELLDKEINFEDMIVSALITVSPQKVYIHTREPEMQVIKTILNIFENRSLLCINCKSCQPYLGGKSQNQ